jgi:hypothetical protein
LVRRGRRRGERERRRREKEEKEKKNSIVVPSLPFLLLKPRKVERKKGRWIELDSEWMMISN